MHGIIAKDFFIEERDSPNMAPFSGYLMDPIFRRSNYTLPVMGSKKLDGLYNTQNMNVFYASAGQPSAGNIRQGGTRNMGLSKIAFPNRMPYAVTTT